MASKKKAEDSPARSAKTPAKAGTTRRAPRKAAKSDSSKEPAAKTEAKAAPSKASGKAAYAVPVPSGRVVVEREISGRTLTLETGRMAKLSDGAVVARYGDTMVLACVNSGKAPEGIDFFPLTVDYREKTSAAGIIPGGFFKREGRPTTKEILACRIIDRSIRPMFPDGFRREVQVLSQVLSTDRENDPDVVAAIASFAALALSSVPHGTTLGMVRIGLVNDKLQVNPLWSTIQSAENQLNLTVAGSDEAVVMVEAGAKEVSEETMLEALQLAHKVVREIVAMIEELAEKAGKPKMEFVPPKRDEKLVAAIEDQFGAALRAAPVTPGPKQVRSAAIKAAKDQACSAFPAPAGSTEGQAKAWNANIAEIVGGIVKQGERESILKGKRADGRDTKTIRQITIEVGVLPRVHGSVLFTRGETQALGIITLGGTDDQQIIDGLMKEPKKRFLLHYNFPPYSVGEVKRMMAPGRREIGHGALAERGLEPVLPTKEEFPYTIRVNSEILESNGSSSMATVCAGTLGMMDAGVPIKRPCAGIAMGLVMEGKRYAVLSDILGSEDACGDMDFKVVGTGNGITALQMDIKCDGLTREILAEALEQARQGRVHILREMLKALRAPREQISPNAPRLESIQVPSEKIGLIIGPGGKNIRAMQEQFECKIAIEDGGMCTVTGVNSEKVMACINHLKSMTAEIELGGTYEGRVTAIKEFGAFVEILPGQEGLVHVSELSDEFIRAVTDVVRIGDVVKVKVIAIDDFGKVKLSRKALLAPGGGGGGGGAAAPAEAAPAEGGDDRGERRPRHDRGPRREERDDRGGRDREPRGFDDRGGRPDRGERRPREGWSERGGDERGPREARPVRDDRAAREDRPVREERPAREERPLREDRPIREERGPRVERDDRPAREERGPRADRPMRDDRGPREDRPMRDDRGPRVDRPVRDDRGPREDRPVRDDRSPRADRPMRDDRGFREDRPMRDDRGPREDRPVRDDRGPRGDRPVREDRAPREDRPVRDDRGPRGDRPVREDRAPREDRPVRDDRGPREDRPVRDDRGPRTRDERPVRTPRPERGGRGGSSDMPMAEFEDNQPAPPVGFDDVGGLEPIENLLGEPRRPSGGRDGGRDGRRPRRR